MANQRAVLLIADIGGYTRFMTVHRINLAHSQYVVAELLEAIIDAGEPVLQLAKLEGDAAFFYATVRDDDADLTSISGKVADIHRAFVRRRNELEIDRLCSCDGCVQVAQLKLKFVSHVGEVAFQRIKRLTELAGVDVIFVHRMLKNSVPVPEYVLMSENLYQRIDEPLRGAAHAIDEELEGLGTVRAFYVDLEQVVGDLPPSRAPSWWRKLWAWARMTWRSVPYFLGMREPCKAFRNMGDVDPTLAPPSDAPASTPPLE